LLFGDRYRPLEAMGGDRVSPTFLAVDERHPSNIPCIIKQFRSRSIEDDRLAFREAVSRLYRTGLHPQLPQLLAYFPRDDRHYLVWEFITGENLEQRLETATYLNEVRVRRLLIAVLLILNVLHREHLIHRNIKPANIIDRNGKLILVGFGSAKYATRENLVKTGTVVGSAEYTAPEQLQGQATFASDIYSLGAVCLYLLTGSSPFELFDVNENKWRWRDYLPEPVSDKFAGIIDKTIALPLQQRYTSVLECLEDLDPNVATAFRASQQRQQKRPPTFGWKRDRVFTPDIGTAIDLDFFDLETLVIAAQNRIYLNRTNTEDLDDFASTESSILACTVSRNGNVLATGNEDGSVDVWQRDGEKIAHFKGHLHAVETLAIDEKGKFVVSGSRDRTAKLWSIETGEEIRTFPEAEAPIASVVFHRNSNLLVIGDRAGNIGVWCLDTGEFVRNLKEDTEAIVNLALCKEGRILISSHWNRVVNVWNVEVGCLLYQVDRILLPASSVAIFSNLRNFVVGGYDGSLRTFDLNSGELWQQLGDRSQGIEAIAVSPNGETVASCSQQGTIEIWQRVPYNSLQI